MIRVKYICEPDGYKLYTSESGRFIKIFTSHSLDPSDPEIGDYTYGKYLYSGSKEIYIQD
jgi:hypothetical protein